MGWTLQAVSCAGVEDVIGCALRKKVSGTGDDIRRRLPCLPAQCAHDLLRSAAHVNTPVVIETSHLEPRNEGRKASEWGPQAASSLEQIAQGSIDNKSPPVDLLRCRHAFRTLYGARRNARLARQPHAPGPVCLFDAALPPPVAIVAWHPGPNAAAGGFFDPANSPCPRSDEPPQGGYTMTISDVHRPRARRSQCPRSPLARPSEARAKPPQSAPP